MGSAPYKVLLEVLSQKVLKRSISIHGGQKTFNLK